MLLLVYNQITTKHVGSLLNNFPTSRGSIQTYYDASNFNI